MNYILEYPESALLYIFILITGSFFSYLGSLKKYRNNTKTNIWIYALILLLSIFAGFRNGETGVDTAHYIIRYMEPIREGAFWSITDMSIGFKFIVWFTYLFTNHTFIVFTVIALITNSCIILRLWDYRNKSSFLLMFIMYYGFYYLITFNLFRQFLSIAIVFYYSRYIELKRYKTYIVGVVLAIMIHNISILGFMLIPIDILLSNENLKERKIRRIVLLLSPIIILVISWGLLNYFDFDHYIHLLNRPGNHGSNGISIPIKMLLGFIMYYGIRKRISYNINDCAISLAELNKIISIYFIGLLIGLTSYISYEAERLTYYFVMFEPILVSIKVKKNFQIQIIRYLYILFTIYSLYSKLAGGGSKIIPYTFFWQ